MLTVGDRFPAFSLEALASRDPHRATLRLTEQDYPGRWKAWFAWPNDFTPVCPTEILSFGEHHEDFLDHDCEVLGFSIDSIHVHRAWRRAQPDLLDLPFPLVADPRRELATALGILHPTEGVCLRATFLVAPDGVIRWACAHDLRVGRNVDEVLRVLAALQAGGLCRCGWEPGDPFLTLDEGP
jgi:alkyl hydroperoxide reductase subunit AhpC